MKTIKIHLRMASIDEALRADKPASKRSIPLPYKVLGNQGQLLAEGVADAERKTPILRREGTRPRDRSVAVIGPYRLRGCPVLPEPTWPVPDAGPDDGE